MNNNLEDEELEELNLENQEQDFIDHIELEEDYLEDNLASNYNNYNQLKQNFRNNNNNTTNSLQEKIRKNKTRNLFNKNQSFYNKQQKNDSNDVNDENNNEEKKSTLKDKTSDLAKKTKQKVGNAAKESGKAFAKNIVKVAKILLANPIFWVISGVLLLIFLIPILWGAYDGDSSNGSNNANITKSSEISLKRTSLTKSEFVDMCNKQSRHSDFYSKCDKIYDISIKNNFNPEMVVIRATVEGFSPGASKNNYWGIGCYNGAGYGACISYGSFEAGVEAFIKNVSQYETVDDMMSKYAYIGHNWYNPGSSADGGCYYYPYIKQYMSSGRANTVAKYCADNNRCKGTMCQPTNDEDQLAYAKWQVSNMVSVGNGIFGTVTEDVASTDYVSNDIPQSVEDLKQRYYFAEYDFDWYVSLEYKQLFAQCVWYAKHRAMEIIASSNLSEEEKQKRIQSIDSTSGNGQDVVPNMNGNIFKKTTNINEIKAPAIISWSLGSYGHVGIIEQITTDKNGNKVYYITDGGRIKDTKNYPYWYSKPASELWNTVNFWTKKDGTVDTIKYRWPGSGYTFNGVAMLLE